MYKLKDYRNVKCGDLPSVPTMKQSVCVCVCAVQHSAPVFSCCCCCSEKWLSFEEVRGHQRQAAASQLSSKALQGKREQEVKS